MLVDFINKTNYTCDIVAFDELTDFINDMQWEQDQSFEWGGKMADVSLKLSAKDIYEKDFEKLWPVVIVVRK